MPHTDGGSARQGCAPVFGPSTYVGVTHVSCDDARPVIKRAIRHPLQDIPGWSCTFDRRRTTGHCHRIGTGGIAHWTPGDPPLDQTYEKDDFDGRGTSIELDIVKPGDVREFGTAEERAHVTAGQWFVRLRISRTGTPPLRAPCGPEDLGFSVDTHYRWFYVLDRRRHGFRLNLKTDGQRAGLDGTVQVNARPGRRGRYEGSLRIRGRLEGCAAAPYDSGPVSFVATANG